MPFFFGSLPLVALVSIKIKCHLLFDHAELLVHCLEVVSEEARPVKQLLEVPQGDLTDRARQAAIREIEEPPRLHNVLFVQ